jgi:excisionase family DNA binding protein
MKGGVVLVSDQQVSVPPAGVTVTPELLEAPGPEEAADFLTARQFARRLGISHETVRRLAIAGELPCTVVCRGARKTTRRYPRRFADEFAASGLDVADLAELTTRWRARVAGARR